LADGFYGRGVSRDWTRGSPTRRCGDLHIAGTSRFKEIEKRFDDLARRSVGEGALNPSSRDAASTVTLPAQRNLPTRAVGNPHRPQQRNFNRNCAGSGRFGEDGSRPYICNGNLIPIAWVELGDLKRGLCLNPLSPSKNFRRESVAKLCAVLHDHFVEEDCD